MQMIRVVQIQNGNRRAVAMVDEPHLVLVDTYDSLYALARRAISAGTSLSSLIQNELSDQWLDYDAVYAGESDWQLLVPFDHPDGPGGTLVSGTGLTHFGSARDRQAMHLKDSPESEQNQTDSMKMFRWGVDGGRPKPGEIGIAPEWFYKGNGAILRAHDQPLEVPFYAEDGGEEAEITGVYLIGTDGVPHRVGMATGNEFSDHQFEKRNYLNLAGSKLRTCALGPELVIDPPFESVAGEARIERGNRVVWSKAVRTGESEMCHSLANIEHHHFKFETHRRPGDVHVHFFGAHSLSFGENIRLADGDTMVIRWDGYGRPLRNTVRIMTDPKSKPQVAIPLR